MSGLPDTGPESRRLDAVYRAKARAEIGRADARAEPEGRVRGQGDVLAEVLLVKGAPGADDRRTGRALSGGDGTAVGKALDALGLPKARYAFCTAARGSRAAVLERTRLLTEAVDPRYVVLLDAVAARDFSEALDSALPEPGVAGTIHGRTVVATEDFEAALGDAAAKRRVWHQLQALAAGRPDETDAP